MSEGAGVSLSDLRSSPLDTFSSYSIPDSLSEHIRSSAIEAFLEQMQTNASYTGNPFYYRFSKPVIKSRLRNFDDKFNKVLRQKIQEKQTGFDWDWLRTPAGEFRNTFAEDASFTRISVTNLCQEVELPVRPFSGGPIAPPRITADSFRFTQFR